MIKLTTLIWIIVLILVLPLATATGIRPAKTSLVFEETKDYVGTFWIVNNDAREFAVNVYVEGEMASYVTLKTREAQFRSDTDAIPIDYEVHLPGDVPPGTSTANIVVEENFGSAADNVISSKLVLKHKIIVEGPYPDKYIKTKLNFHDRGDVIELVSEVENLGKKDIGEIKTVFYLNDKEQQEHALETETASLKTKENKLLKARLEKSVLERGEFEVAAITTYDDQKVEMIQKLLVGEPEVEITYFDRYFIAHTINQYSLDLLNKWNRRVENVFVDVEVLKDNQKVDAFRTKSVDIEGEMTRRINDYLDAKEKGEGTYTFDMVVNFWNTVQMTQRTFQFQSEFVSEEEAETLVVSSPATGKATATGGSGLTASTILWMLAGIIAGGVGAYLVWRYKHRKEYEGGDDGAL